MSVRSSSPKSLVDKSKYKDIGRTRPKRSDSHPKSARDDTRDTTKDATKDATTRDATTDDTGEEDGSLSKRTPRVKSSGSSRRSSSSRRSHTTDSLQSPKSSKRVDIVMVKMDNEVEAPKWNLKFSDLPLEIQKEWTATNIPTDELEEHAEIVWYTSLFMMPAELKEWCQSKNLITDSFKFDSDDWERVYASQKILDLGKNEIQLPPKGKMKKVFKLSQQTGSGGFGSVFLAKDLTLKHRVAIKRISHLPTEVQTNNFSEIGFLKSCDHPNIVKYYKTLLFNDPKKNLVEIWISTEYLDGGTLSDAARFHSFSSDHCAFISREILKALQYIHSMNCIHRDLKSANVMIAISGQIKLIDFGLCCDERDGTRTKACGSPYWVPPEMIMKKPHSFPADIWSLGICILELWLQTPPHYTQALKCIFSAVKGEMPKEIPREKMPAEAVDWMEKCLQVDPKKRPSADVLLKHPWISKPNIEDDFPRVLRRIFTFSSLTDL